MLPKHTKKNTNEQVASFAQVEAPAEGQEDDDEDRVEDAMDQDDDDDEDNEGDENDADDDAEGDDVSETGRAACHVFMSPVDNRTCDVLTQYRFFPQ